MGLGMIATKNRNEHRLLPDFDGQDYQPPRQKMLSRKAAEDNASVRLFQLQAPPTAPLQALPLWMPPTPGQPQHAEQHDDESRPGVVAGQCHRRCGCGQMKAHRLHPQRESRPQGQLNGDFVSVRQVSTFPVSQAHPGPTTSPINDRPRPPAMQRSRACLPGQAGRSTARRSVAAGDPAPACRGGNASVRQH